MKNLLNIDQNLSAYLDNELEVSDKQKLQATLKKNPNLQIKLAELREISSYLATDRDDEIICQDIKVVMRQARIERTKKTLFWVRWVLPTTVGFLLGLAFIVSYFYSPNVTTKDLYAQYQAAFDDVLVYTDENFNYE